MATFYADRDGPAPHVGGGAQKVSVYKTYTFTAAPSAADVVEMVKVPSGAIVTNVVLGADDLDTNGSPTIVLDVGDGSDTDRFIDGATSAQAGGTSAALAGTAGSFGYQYSSDDTIDITVQAGPATGATGTVRLLVEYVMG